MSVANTSWITVEKVRSETVATRRQRTAVGLEHWVDGTFGVHRRGGATTVIAPNGPVLARHRFAGDLAGSLLSGLEDPAAIIVGLPDDVDHASGGPLHYDRESGLLLLVYHGERFTDGDPSRYRSFVGLAVSYDEGSEFHDLGPIVRTHAELLGVEGAIDVGSGAFAVRGGWFEVYYQDRACGVPRSNLSVARCAVSEVMSAAREGIAPDFWKWGGQAFDEPGLGGRDVEVFPVPRSWIGWFDSFVDDSTGTVALVCSGHDLRESTRWVLFITTSGDGVHWTEPVQVDALDHGTEGLYVTVVPDDQHAGRIDLYTVRASSDPRWADAELVRTTCDLFGPGSAALQIR